MSIESINQSPVDVANYLKKERNPRPIEDIAEEIGVGVDFVRAGISSLKNQGYGIDDNGEMFIRSKTSPERDVFDLGGILSKDFKIGAISDPHLASKKERLEDLQATYEIFKSQGVSVVLNAGDITDGWGVYRGQEFEVKYFGQEEQIAYTVAKYPQVPGIITLFITGNHDLKQYEKGGVDPGVAISQQREDMKYLGQVYAKVRFPNGAMAELLHPGGGTAYALSYKPQRFINNLAPQDVPDIMVWGHYHTSFYMHYRNVNFIQAPCFKDAGIFEKRLGLNPTIGAWIIEGKISDQGNISKFKPELITFDQKK